MTRSTGMLKGTITNTVPLGSFLIVGNIVDATRLKGALSVFAHLWTLSYASLMHDTASAHSHLQNTRGELGLPSSVCSDEIRTRRIQSVDDLDRP